jgi:hypothetical protein
MLRCDRCGGGNRWSCRNAGSDLVRCGTDFLGGSFNVGAAVYFFLSSLSSVFALFGMCCSPQGFTNRGRRGGIFFLEPHRGDRATRGGNPSRAIGDRKMAGTIRRRGLFRISNSESLAIAMECETSSSSGSPSVSLDVPAISFFCFSRMGDLGSFFVFW